MQGLSIGGVELHGEAERQRRSQMGRIARMGGERGEGGGSTALPPGEGATASLMLA